MTPPFSRDEQLLRELGPLPEARRNAELIELDDRLRKQALRDPRLQKTLDLLEQYPVDGAMSSRILKLSLLEFSRQLQIMQSVAELLMGLGTSPVPLSTVIDKATKEVEGDS